MGRREVATGHWVTTPVTTMVEEVFIERWEEQIATRQVRVQTGTKVVTWEEWVSTFDRFEEIPMTGWVLKQVGTRIVTLVRQVLDYIKEIITLVPVQKWKEVTVLVWEQQKVPEKLVRTEEFRTKGMMSFKREIRSLRGEINGKLTLVTTSDVGVKIDGNLVYVDDDDQTRMLNGDDPSKPYVPNKQYDGHSVLGIISAGDIIYSKDVPKRLEINASMISTQGKVAFEGMVVSGDGETVGTTLDAELRPQEYQKESIRRLGGIACKFRPIFTLVDGSNQVRCGFAKGVSHMDGRLLLTGSGGTLPPFVPLAYRPIYALTSLGMRIPTEVR